MDWRSHHIPPTRNDAVAFSATFGQIKGPFCDVRVEGVYASRMRDFKGILLRHTLHFLHLRTIDSGYWPRLRLS